MSRPPEGKTEDCCVPEEDPGHPAVLEHLERYRFAARFAGSKDVLDIACGAGYGSHLLLEEGKARTVRGVDYSPRNIEYCRRTYKDENLRFEQGDICSFQLERKADLIVCFETIEHVERYREALGRLAGALDDDGILIISTPNRRITDPYAGPDTPTMGGAHKREFTPDEFLGAVGEAGFQKIGYYGQRLQSFFPNPFLEKHYKRLFKPSRRASAAVTEVDHREPEFMVFLFKKSLPK
jgi:SAM-dependent methyltransferase